MIQMVSGRPSSVVRKTQPGSASARRRPDQLAALRPALEPLALADGAEQREDGLGRGLDVLDVGADQRRVASMARWCGRSEFVHGRRRCPASASSAIRWMTDATTYSRPCVATRSSGVASRPGRFGRVSVQITAEDVIGARPPSTSFVGRRDELGRLRALIASSRLLTITGPGGSGKTRLAEELVTQLARSFGGGIAFAYLAGAGEPAEVGDVVAAVGRVARRRRTACGPRRVPAATAVPARAGQLRARPGAGGRARRAAPRVVSGGHRARDEPPRRCWSRASSCSRSAGSPSDAAVTLFTDRVRLASPSFVLPEDQRPLVVELCARLDGMPLAIELAAARLRHLGLAELEERLSGHLADLGSDGLWPRPSASGPSAARSAGVTTSWTNAQRVLWRRLSIFVGGFTLGAAEAVAALPPLDAGRRRAAAGRARRPVDGRLRPAQRPVSGDRGDARVRSRAAPGGGGGRRRRPTRHRAWMLERAEDLDRRWWGPDQATALDEMSADAANLRAALESCRAVGAGEDGLRIATGSLWYWMTRASHAEAARWFVPFLEHASDPALGGARPRRRRMDRGPRAGVSTRPAPSWTAPTTSRGEAADPASTPTSGSSRASS